MDLIDASLNSITVRQANLSSVLDLAVEHGFGHVALWRGTYREVGADRAARMVAARGLGVSSVCRGGMFPQVDAALRARQHQDNCTAVREAATLSARCLVLVCGGVLGRDITGSREQIRDGIADLLPVAAAAGVRLALEPMHPMMAADRSAITSLGEANVLLAELGAGPGLGIALDAYHVWWDVRVDDEIARAGHNLLSVQVSDWILPINDQLSSRGMPGEGCIDLDHFLQAVASTDYQAPVEVEVLNAANWHQEADAVVRRAAQAMAAL